MMKKLLVVVGCSSLLFACSSGGASAPGVSSSALPAMPDRTANNASLAGIDTTGTGVRDDVHRYIFQTYTSTHKRNAMMQSAKSMRGIYLNPPQTQTEALVLAKSVHRATDCFYSYAAAGYFSDMEAYKMSRQIEALHADTKARMQAYEKYNQLLDGTGEPLGPTAGTCDAGGGL